MHAIVARLRIRPENRAEFLEASQAIIAGTRAEAGCLFYALHEDAHDPCSFLFYEEWQDRAAIEPWVVEKSLVIHEVASSEHP